MLQRRLITLAFVAYVLSFAGLFALIVYALLERTLHAIP